jgi:hypothetical protein
MADAVEPAELFDVDVDHLAGLLALIAAHRGGRLKRIDPVQSQPLEDTADGGRRDAELGGDLLSGVARSAQYPDLLDNSLWRGLSQPMRSRAAVAQSGQTLATKPLNPLANRPRADACGLADRLRRLPALDKPHNPLSTMPRQTGILVHVHPVLREKLEASTTSASSVRTGWTTYGKLTSSREGGHPA